jgi:hypothetical protein
MVRRRSHGTPVERNTGPVTPSAKASSAAIGATPTMRPRKMG